METSPIKMKTKCIDDIYTIHIQIQDFKKLPQFSIDFIRNQLYMASKNEEKQYSFIISFSKNENNEYFKDDVGDINVLVKNKIINNLYADLYNYIFMEYDKWDLYIGASKQLLKELNITIDMVPYDNAFDMEIKNNNKLSTEVKKKRGKNARKKENRKKQKEKR